jgi:hypothetical protein
MQELESPKQLVLSHVKGEHFEWRMDKPTNTYLSPIDMIGWIVGGRVH